MNLFRLDDDSTLSAIYNQDLHVRKIILEATQLLANCYSLEQLNFAPKTQTGNVRKYSHLHHPISIWVKENRGNFDWTREHLRGLLREYNFRFNKNHFCATFLDFVDKNAPDLPNLSQTEQPQCFANRYPELVVPGNPVQGYRNYYKADKMFFTYHYKNGKTKVVNATWTNRETPEFMR